MLFKFMLRSFVTLHENVLFYQGLYPMAEVVKVLLHFVEVNSLNEPCMVIKGGTKVKTRCDLECVKVSFACRTLFLKGDVKGSQTPSALSLSQTENKWITYGPSFLTQL